MNVKTDESRFGVLSDKITFMDVILIVTIVVLSTGIVLQAKLDTNWSTGKTVNAAVYQGGHLHQLLELNEDREIPLQGGKMILEIQGEKIRVKKSECPRQVCVRVGWISHSGEAIVCVPYRTAIEIGASGKSDIDAVVF